MENVKYTLCFGGRHLESIGFLFLLRFILDSGAVCKSSCEHLCSLATQLSISGINDRLQYRPCLWLDISHTHCCQAAFTIPLAQVGDFEAVSKDLIPPTLPIVIVSRYWLQDVEDVFSYSTLKDDSDLHIYIL
jgi:hypothetical protein